MFLLVEGDLGVTSCTDSGKMNGGATNGLQPPLTSGNADFQSPSSRCLYTPLEGPALQLP
jgi:hypothetical protein